MGGNWKSFYQQKFLDGKILQFFFFGLSVSMKFLYLGIVKKKNEKEIFIAVLLKNLNFFIQWILHKNYKTVFFAQLHVSTCPKLLLMELPIWQGNGQVFSCSTLISVLLMLEQYGWPNTSTPKNDFFPNSI